MPKNEEELCLLELLHPGLLDLIFAILRFRTETIKVKEMTYFFVIIGVSAINALSNNNTTLTELLIANSYNAEGTGTDIDIVSNGFKVRSTSGNINTSGNNYIYIAFAHMPFKYALAR